MTIGLMGVNTEAAITSATNDGCVAAPYPCCVLPGDLHGRESARFRQPAF